ELQVRQGAYLPHWTREGATYSVCFRLADSLPQEVLKAWIAERQALEARAMSEGVPLTQSELDRLAALHSERVENYLDTSYGECWLRRPDIAAMVEDELKHFEG